MRSKETRKVYRRRKITWLHELAPFQSKQLEGMEQLRGSGDEKRSTRKGKGAKKEMIYGKVEQRNGIGSN